MTEDASGFQSKASQHSSPTRPPPSRLRTQRKEGHQAAAALQSDVVRNLSYPMPEHSICASTARCRTDRAAWILNTAFFGLRPTDV